jgi:hypothetical protein
MRLCSGNRSAFNFQGLYSFPYRGSPRGCEIFNEAEPMYPKAVIKASFPQNLDQNRVEIANKVSFVFDKFY